jgi:hypothetical protein
MTSIATERLGGNADIIASRLQDRLAFYDPLLGLPGPFPWQDGQILAGGGPSVGSERDRWQITLRGVFRLEPTDDEWHSLEDEAEPVTVLNIYVEPLHADRCRLIVTRVHPALAGWWTTILEDLREEWPDAPPSADVGERTASPAPPASYVPPADAAPPRRDPPPAPPRAPHHEDWFAAGTDARDLRGAAALSKETRAHYRTCPACVAYVSRCTTTWERKGDVASAAWADGAVNGGTPVSTFRDHRRKHCAKAGVESLSPRDVCTRLTDLQADGTTA